MLERLRELKGLKVTTLKRRTSHIHACNVERTETSDFILAPLPEDNQRFFASLRMTTISFSF
jgi:hypothetical protein